MDNENPTYEPPTSETGIKTEELRPKDAACQRQPFDAWIKEERAKATTEAHAQADEIAKECELLQEADGRLRMFKNISDSMKFLRDSADDKE